MAKVLERMRGHYKAHVDERATIGKVDGVQLAKRRKLNAAGRQSPNPQCINLTRAEKIFHSQLDQNRSSSKSSPQLDELSPSLRPSTAVNRSCHPPLYRCLP